MREEDEVGMTNKELSKFVLQLRDRHEMPITEDEYHLLGEVAERLTGIRGRRYKKKNRLPVSII